MLRRNVEGVEIVILALNLGAREDREAGSLEVAGDGIGRAAEGVERAEPRSGADERDVDASRKLNLGRVPCKCISTCLKEPF